MPSLPRVEPFQIGVAPVMPAIDRILPEAADSYVVKFFYPLDDLNVLRVTVELLNSDKPLQFCWAADRTTVTVRARYCYFWLRTLMQPKVPHTAWLRFCEPVDSAAEEWAVINLVGLSDPDMVGQLAHDLRRVLGSDVEVTVGDRSSRITIHAVRVGARQTKKQWAELLTEAGLAVTIEN
jgi:hypothetical protein